MTHLTARRLENTPFAADAHASPTPRGEAVPLSQDLARAWLDRWDRQQGGYFSDREERFAVVVDVLRAHVDRPDPLVVDLGAGPGSLARRILAAIPGAEVIAVDMDPLLLGLGEAVPVPGLRFVRQDLRTPGWWDALGCSRRPDAIVSSTALHYLQRDALVEVLRLAAAQITPGGYVIDADHIWSGDPDEDALCEIVGQQSCRRGPGHDAEDWVSWWTAVDAAPELAELREARRCADLAHTEEQVVPADHLAALRAGGCRSADVVRQSGLDRIVVGRR